MPALAALIAQPGAAGQPGSEAVARAVALLREGKRVEARAILTALYLDAKGDRARKIREVLDGINKELVFNPSCLEGAVIHTVQAGERGVKIAKSYKVNWGMIARLNGLKEDETLSIGQKLKVLTGRTRLVAHKAEFRLALLIENAYVKEYPIAIGLDDKTPSGDFTVKNMLIRPPWTSPTGIIKYGEPGYLLGERWIGFVNAPGATGLGIHGTSDDATIGTKCSNGCVRLRNNDVVELYDFLQVGSKVQIAD